MDATVIVGTFGEERWALKARDRAIPSAEVEVIHSHCEFKTTYGEALARCRNEGAERADSEWLCFLDADDELAPGYFEAMAKATGDLRTPAVQYIRNGRVRRPMFWPDLGLEYSNYLIVSTLIRREMFFAVGGFRDVPMYEDWDLFQRCWKAGATIERVPEAICRVYINLRSIHRNGSTRQEKIEAREHVQRLNFPEMFEEAAA